MSAVNKDELNLIEKQLGRSPDNLLAVASYCPFTRPAVLLVDPFGEDGRVFPTTYWLSCPYLVAAVSSLEDRGGVQEFTEKLQNDLRFREAMERAHRDYAAKRLELLTPKKKQKIAGISPNILKVLTSSGVGGIMDKQGVKCLHTHLAHYLVGGNNPVGEQVFDRLGWPENCNCHRYIKKEADR